MNPETLDVPAAAATSDLLERAFLAAQFDTDVGSEQTNHLYELEFDVFTGFIFGHYTYWILYRVHTSKKGHRGWRWP